MPELKRKIKIVTEQRIKDTNAALGEGELPIRKWNIEIFSVLDNGDAVPATIFDRVLYELHPSFGPKRAKQSRKEAPFRIEEEGWGEFEMFIHLSPLGKSPEIVLPHDLNFQQNRYETFHDVAFKSPKPELLAALENMGSGEVSRHGDAAKKRGRKDKNVDMEKLADGLQKLLEDDLLHVIQLIHDHKTAETYTKNDVEAGEFHVDLYTLPDSLVKQLWDFTLQKVKV